MSEYAALFVAAFLAATLLPFPSELPLGLLVRAQGEVVWPVVVATVGNYLGACTTYFLARGVIARRAESRAGRSAVALGLFRRYGSAALALSWVPVIGDAIVALAGASRTPFPIFSAWTIAGKASRYVVVGWLATRGS